MFLALNDNNKLIHIDNYNPHNNYYCPVCGNKVIGKRGDIRIHHFAHFNSECSDHWNYDMSEWHYDWQQQFPKENQEVVLSKGLKKHRADVLINNTVIEFQHSPIFKEEFEERNSFYTALGYKVIWVFDVIEAQNTGRLEYIDNRNNGELFQWKYPNGALQNFNYKNKQVQVFLQTADNIWKEHPDYKDFEYYDDLEMFLIGNLISIDWISPQGFQRFISNTCYDDIEFLKNYIEIDFQRKPKQVDKSLDTKIGDLIAFETHSIGNGFYGYCPKVKNEYNHNECLFCNYLDTSSFLCTYRFRDIDQSRIENIHKINRDEFGRITSMELSIGGETQIYEYENLTPWVDTIQNLWNRFPKIAVAIFINIKTGRQVKVANVNKNIEEKRKVLGYLGFENSFDFYQTRSEIFYWNEPLWMLKWFKEKP